MRGRKPNLKLIEGGAAPGRCPVAPSWLTPQAKAEWKRAAPQLHARKLLTPDTLATLESYCIAIGLVRECEDIMSREGRMVEGEDGAKPHAGFQDAGRSDARGSLARRRTRPHAAPSRHEGQT